MNTEITKKETQELKMFFVSFTSKNEVLIASPDSEEDTYKNIFDGLTAQFGPDGFKIEDFHVAGEQEMKDFDLSVPTTSLN